MRFATINGVLAACGMVLALAPEIQAKPGQDWSRVQDVEAPRAVRIVLYDEEAPEGKLRLRGIFASATADSLTIVLQDGTSRTFPRDEVRRVSVERAFLQRRKAWGLTALAVFGALAIDLLRTDHDSLARWWSSGSSMQSVGLIAVPVWVIATFELSHKPIYAMPKP